MALTCRTWKWMWQARVQACLLNFVRGGSVLINCLGESRSRGSASKDSVCVQVSFGRESDSPRRLITVDIYIYTYSMKFRSIRLWVRCCAILCVGAIGVALCPMRVAIVAIGSVISEIGCLCCPHIRWYCVRLGASSCVLNQFILCYPSALQGPTEKA